MPETVARGQLTLEDALRGDAAFDTEEGRLVPPPVFGAPPVGPATSRLRRLWVANFKGFESFEISFGDFNVLAGANNAGKSTLLQAADLLYRLVDLHRQGGHLASGRILPAGILPVARLRDIWYRQRYRVRNEFIPAIIGAEFQDGGLIEFGVIGPFGAANSRLLRADGFDEARLNLLAARPAVWVPSSVGIVRDEEYRPPARRHGLIAAGRHNEILRNQLVDLQKREPEFAELQRLLVTYFGGRVGNVQFNELVDQFVTADYEEDGIQHDLYSVGAGFVQVLQLLSFILSRNPGVVLLDEPDAHLHSSLQRTVVDVLDNLSRTREMQVIVSTHSKEIINYVDPSRLILIEKGARQASPFGVSATQLSILQSLGEIDSVDALALVRNKRCLFVEGPTDIAVVERLAARLGLADYVGDDRIVVIPVGGATRFEHVEQLTVLEMVLGSQIASFEIRDRDGRTDTLRLAAMSSAVRPLHILDRDCLESYLVNPTVLARVVAAVSQERGGTAAPTPADIELLALEETEKLRVAALDRAADRYSREQHRVFRQFPSIAEANAAAREFVESNWADLVSRLRVVPGKQLLAAVRSRLQAELSVSFGNPRLVEEFAEDEIVQELRNLLRDVSAVAGSGGTTAVVPAISTADAPEAPFGAPIDITHAPPS